MPSVARDPSPRAPSAGTPQADGPYYTLAQAMAVLGVSRATLWRWIRAGRLPAYKAGPRATRIRRDDLDAFLRRGDAAPQARADLERAWLSEAVASSADSVIVRDLQGTILAWNPGAERLFGYRAEEVVGTSIRELVPPEHRSEVDDLARLAARGERLDQVEAIRMRRDGTRIEVAMSVSPIRDAEGRVVALCAIGRDISARKRAEHAERLLGEIGQLLARPLDFGERLDALARAVLPTLADIATIDLLQPDGSTRRAAGVHADPARQALLEEVHRRYPPGPKAAHPYFGVVHTGRPAFHPRIPPTVVDAVAQDERHRELIEALAPGSLIIVPLAARDRTLGALSLTRLVGSRPYDEDDLALAMEVAARASLALENALLYEQARAALRARDEFISLISHELRNPLAALKGHAQLMQRRASYSERSVAAILGQTDHLARLIDDLLAVSRLETGALALRPEPLDLVALARSHADEARATTDRHAIRVVAPDRPLVGAWDRDRLGQVFRNLLGNAVKYSPDGGEIVVLVEDAGREARVAIRDHGVGMRADVLANLFDRFYRAEEVAATVRGLGLGLYITRQLVEAHGGAIRAESDGPGLGSTFTLTLPYAGRPDAGAAGGAAADDRAARPSG